MAHAYKCDRCGSLYETHNSERKIMKPSLKAPMSRIFKGITIDTDESHMLEFDLCPYCLDYVINWVNEPQKIQKEVDRHLKEDN